MTPKQKRFVKEYQIDSNATQAAVRAGYSKKTAQAQGSRLLTNVMVAKALGVGEAKAAERLDITLDWLVEQSREVLRLAMDESPLLDRYGKPTGSTKSQLGPANKAIENIARMTGHWIERSVNLPVDSWDELMNVVSGRSAQLVGNGQDRVDGESRKAIH